MLEWQDDVKSSAHFLIIFSHLNFVNTFCWATPGSGLPEYWAGLGSVCLLAYWHHNGVKFFPMKNRIQVRNTNTKSNFPKSFHFWSLDLLEAIQGIAFQCQNFVVNLLNFSVFHHVFISSLDMFKKCINSYHIESKQVQTCLRILWIVTINIILNLNKFRHVWTCSDMFKNHINSYRIESEQG